MTFKPRKGDKAQFRNSAPASRYYQRWATVAHVHRNGFIDLAYPDSIRISLIRTHSKNLMFHKPVVKFTCDLEA